ncbi:MAG: DNA polymerase III subunit gamma/tau [Thermodesulfobacteriota bacterium]
MSYLVLARKWRPQDFEEVVGQGPVVRILRNAISRNRVPHAMLFSGVRGVGKTTLARIMAKALNCEKQEGDLPCNECESCREIKAGSAIDLHEIDGASNRGIQEIRDLKENIRFLPTKSRYKIMIIDEVHMLTNEAFNALLKTLEEPPEHVIFMFATTELHKIPVTILSRCQRYELKRVPFNELFEFFKKISGAEKVKISDGALEMIAREAAGSVRDGLSLLDQIFSFGGDEMTDEDVREVLGLVDSQVFERLGASLLEANLGEALQVLDQACQAGADLKRFTTDLLYFVRSLIVCRETKSPAELIEGSDRQLSAMTELAGKHSEESLFNLFERLLKGAGEMQYAPHPRLVLEMTFAKAVQGGKLLPISELIGKIDELLASGGGDSDAAPPPEKKTPEPVIAEEVKPVKAPEPVKVSESSPAFTAEPTVDGPTGPSGPELDDSGPAAGSVDEAPQDVLKEWDKFVEYVKDRKGWMAPVLKMSALPRVEGDELLLRYDDTADCRILQQTDNLKTLTEFAQDFFQRELRVKIRTRTGNVDGGKGEELEAPQEERRALTRDPLVQMTAEIFNGHPGSVRTGPRSREIKTGMDEES